MSEPKSNKALTKALDLLSKRSYSKQILIDKLKQKEFEIDEISAAVKKLEDLEFIDDKKYAESLAREYLEIRKYGAYRVKLKLKEKKVPEEIIKEVLSGINQETEDENLLELTEKYLKKNSGLPREKLYRRTLGFLLRRGYSYSKCRDALKECL
ncbi:MAG: regulatory protein RecX [bacterium]